MDQAPTVATARQFQTSPMRNELVQAVTQILEDHFIHTLELRLEEDVPAAADMIVTFFQNAGFVPVEDE